jgi:hypothetical protein
VSLPTHAFIQSGQIDTNSHLSALLGHDDHARAPFGWLVDSGDDTHALHSFEFLFHLRQEGNRYALWY